MGDVLDESLAGFHMGAQTMTPEDPLSGTALTPEERALLGVLSAQASAPLSRRARIILAWDSGMTPEEIAQQVGLTGRTVNRWLSAFLEHRMAVFPLDAVAGAASQARAGFQPSPQDSIPETLTVADLCRRYQVDMPHARQVGHLAAGLFDLTRPVHHLDDRYRDVIYTAGLLHNVALAGGQARHHTRGRDILLQHLLSDLDDLDRAVIAVTTAFHRKAWNPARPENEPAYLALTENEREAALKLSALLRIADGLDYSQSQTTVLSAAQVDPGSVRFSVTGPYAVSDAARAEEKADLWCAVFGVPLLILVHSSETDADTWFQAPSGSPGVLPDDPMSEVGRKIMRFHFRRMLHHEPGTRSGEDIEALHDMRVAIRRMRSAHLIFGGYYRKKTSAYLRRELRRAGRALGAVRDLDVFMENVQAYLSSLPAGRRSGLDGIMGGWHAEREEARAAMLDYLNSSRFRAFIQSFSEFVGTPGLAARALNQLEPVCVRHVAPGRIYESFDRLRAFETILHEADIPTLHQARIEAKRLRYNLEFFREVLGPEAGEVIKAIVRLQDHLGALHDADVAQQTLARYLQQIHKAARGGHERASDLEEPVPGEVAAYLEDRQQEMLKLQTTLPAVWEEVVSPELRRKLALAVSVL
jgi:CHAD domain-containing protein